MHLSAKARRKLFAEGGSPLVHHAEMQHEMNMSREFPMKFRKSLKNKKKKK